MRLSVLVLPLLLLLACKRGEIKPMNAKEVPLTDTVTLPSDTVKAPGDTTVISGDTSDVSSGPDHGKQLNYLALGDSYTIGESVEPFENFPNQLVVQLKAQEVFLNPPTIIARTGWTTSELQSAISYSGVIQKFDMVTLLIGVNNQYRGESQDDYRKEFKELLQTAISFAGNDRRYVFVVSIPDWGVTPFGQASGRDTEIIASEIDAFNGINKVETLAAGVSYIDITPASRLALHDNTLVARDGLHPSGKMYLDWAVNIGREVIKNLK